MTREPNSQRRWGRRIAGVAAVIGGIAAIQQFRSYQERRAHSDRLSASITIKRSRFGAPRIIASSRNDALFGLGYAAAGDRLWQMDMYRRAAHGTVSEVVGSDGLSSDRLMRVIGMSRIAHQRVRIMDDDTRSAAEAFAAGVNHRIDTGPVPLEFRTLKYRPDYWNVADSVSVMLLLAWSLSGDFNADITAERLREAIGDDWTDAIYLGSYPENPPIVRQVEDDTRGSPEPADRLPLYPSFGASNAWAVSGRRSVTGSPLLANDPHLELHNPSIWYEAAIEAPGFTVAGVTMPGIPGIVIGRTRDVAWGVTAAMTPQKFLYKERLDESGANVDDSDEWVPIDVHDETILVRDEPATQLRIRLTPRGPLISDVVREFDRESVSLHWTGMEYGHELAAILKTNAARSLDEARQAVEGFTTPPLNVVVADSQGNIGMLVIGKIPLRDRRVGYLAPEEFPPWYIPADGLPAEINPERGWVACANNRLVDNGYPYVIHGLWSSGRRCQRITGHLEAREQHSAGDMRTLQHDIYSVQAQSVVPALLEAVADSAPKWAIEDLDAWDFEMKADSRAALLFETIFREWTQLALAHRLQDPIVDSLMRKSGAVSVPELFAERLLHGKLPDWFDDDTAIPRIAGAAAERALTWLEEQLGSDTDSWSWGALHQLTLRHPLGLLPGPQRKRLTVGPFPVGGSSDTISPMAWLGDKTFKVSAGPSMRFVADLGRPARSWIVTPPGVAGSPLSRHFADQIRDYLLGASHALWPDGTEKDDVVIQPVTTRTPASG